MERQRLEERKNLTKGDVMEILGKALDTPKAFILIRKYGPTFTVTVDGFKKTGKK